MDRDMSARVERAKVRACAAVILWLVTVASIGIALFSDHDGFLRYQATQRALAKEREAEREFGPVIPTSFNL